MNTKNILRLRLFGRAIHLYKDKETDGLYLSIFKIR